MFSDFRRGVLYAVRGIVFFFRNRFLWIHALIPAAAIFLLDLLLLFLFAFFCVIPFIDWVLQWLNSVELLRALLVWIVYLSLIPAALLSMSVTFGFAYELVACLFLDPMIIKFEHKEYGTVFPHVTFGRTLHLLWEAFWYSIGTCLLFLILLIPGLFFPVAGTVVMALILGYRLGISILSGPAFLHDRTLKDLCRAAGAHKFVSIGFGVMCYVLLLLPVSFFLLPGLTTGACMLYHTELDECKKV